MPFSFSYWWVPYSVPDTDRLSWEACSGIEGFTQLWSHPRIFGSKLQSEGTGKLVALLFLLISSL